MLKYNTYMNILYYTITFMKSVISITYITYNSGYLLILLKNP